MTTYRPFLARGLVATLPTGPPGSSDPGGGADHRIPGSRRPHLPELRGRWLIIRLRERLPPAESPPPLPRGADLATDLWGEM